MAAYGLYTHIASNKLRSMLLLAGLFLLIYVLVYAGALIAEVVINSDGAVDTYLAAAARDLIQAFPYATIAAALWIVIAYFFHQSIIDAVTGGEEVTRQQQPRLYNLLENLCISRGIPMPKLKVMDSDALNAFATGLNRSQYAITVTTGLLKALNNQEIEAVLGHELTHIRNGDVQLMVIAVIIAGVVGFFGELFFRMFTNSAGASAAGRRRPRRPRPRLRAATARGRRRDLRGHPRGGADPVAWVLSLVVKLALSRSRELLADAGSVELTKNPDAMISALRKIENRGELPGATSAVMEMCLDNPREGFADLFATHPSVDSRVAALVKFAGGHDPGPLALPRTPTTGRMRGKRIRRLPGRQLPTPAGPWSDADAPAGASRRAPGPSRGALGANVPRRRRR